DDESTDITPNVSRAFAETYPNVRLLSTEGIPSVLRYKKRPLDVGIRSARGEIILLTDADCHVGSTWIESMTSYFEPHVGLVVGFSETAPAKTRFEKLQALDFLLLMAAARGTTQLRLPFACTGQNLAYRKQAFEEVGGFSRFANAVGGDDTLLLQQIKTRTAWKIVFAADPACYASSPPLPTVKGYVSQRLRWASDTLRIPRTDVLLLAMIAITFLANLLSLTMVLTLLFGAGALLPLLKGLGLKFVVEGMLMLKATSLFRRTRLRPIFPAWFFLQIPYVVMVATLTLAGDRLPWGGRHR
ncbi:MAG: glycosyltransferase, partial [Fidelibacterota bacterium]